MCADIVARLRSATGEAHQRLEARLDLFSRIKTPEARRVLVELFYGLHEGAERALAPLLQDIPGLDYSQRQRVPHIEADLAALGRNSPTPIAVCPVYAPASTAEALGFFYVLEGSTLGGKVIRRQLAASGEDMTGLAFLDPYGAASGERWRSVLAVLRREGANGGPRAADRMVAGALSGFRHAEAWLSPTAVAA